VYEISKIFVRGKIFLSTKINKTNKIRNIRMLKRNSIPILFLKLNGVPIKILYKYYVGTLLELCYRYRHTKIPNFIIFLESG